MSKTISAALKAHMAQETTTLATLWKLTRPDTTVFGFTDHDDDIVYSGQRYQAASGFRPTGIDAKLDLSVDNLEVISFLESDKVKEEDMLAGLFDYSLLNVWLVNYEDLTMNHLILAQGWILGEIKIKDNSYVAEIRSKSQLLSQDIIDLYSPGCRAEFGDVKCDADGLLDVPTNWTPVGTITLVSGTEWLSEFSANAMTQADDEFQYGLLTWTSGSNNGYEMEVKKYKLTGGGGQFTLFLDMPYRLQVGDTFKVTYGCDKSKDRCKQFSNVINMRAEPYIPGIDQIRDYIVPQ